MPEEAKRLDPANAVVGGRYVKSKVMATKFNSFFRVNKNVYHNGGEWLNAVFPTGKGGKLTGFIHAEDQFWVAGQGFTGNGKAFKSISLGI